jgi:hypothetical protein
VVMLGKKSGSCLALKLVRIFFLLISPDYKPMQAFVAKKTVLPIFFSDEKYRQDPEAFSERILIFQRMKN